MRKLSVLIVALLFLNIQPTHAVETLPQPFFNYLNSKYLGDPGVILIDKATGEVIYESGSTKFGDSLDDTHQFTGSLLTSGSNIFIGTQTVTGSLRTSGSNTLIGNTQLTGSFDISGSQTTMGYIGFLPVAGLAIPTNQTASYIYTSGSTNDLYFTQYAGDFTNTTRLRWLEGNLYTGLLHGGLITSASTTTFNISSGSGLIVDLNASLTDDPYPTIQFVKWNTFTSQSLTFLT